MTETLAAIRSAWLPETLVSLLSFGCNYHDENDEARGVSLLQAAPFPNPNSLELMG